MEFSNLKIKNIDCVINYKSKKNYWPATNRPNHIIGVKLSGASLHDFGEYKFTLTENCIYFLNQKNDYNVNVLESGEVISVHFTTYEPIDTESFSVKLNNISEIINLLKKIRATGSEHIAVSNFYKLCNLFDEHHKRAYSSSDSRINASKEYIDNHFFEKNCLEVATDICSISRRHFNDLFKKQNNISPNRYVIMRKIKTAEQLLLASNLSIAEIGENCGFKDVGYFSKVFKQETGFTPTKFREMYKKISS